MLAWERSSAREPFCIIKREFSSNRLLDVMPPPRLTSNYPAKASTDTLMVPRNTSTTLIYRTVSSLLIYSLTPLPLFVLLQIVWLRWGSRLRRRKGNLGNGLFLRDKKVITLWDCKNHDMRTIKSEQCWGTLGRQARRKFVEKRTNDNSENFTLGNH